MTNKYTTVHAIKFLCGDGEDAKGRTIFDYLTFDGAKWEQCHDHIQWAFPSDIPSRFNPNAPIVDFNDPQWEENREKIIVRVNRLLRAYFRSIGINPHTMTWLPNSENPNVIWTGSNHNFQRITRILHFMKQTGIGFVSITKRGDDAFIPFVYNADMLYVFFAEELAKQRLQSSFFDTPLMYWMAAADGTLFDLVNGGKV